MMNEEHEPAELPNGRPRVPVLPLAYRLPQAAAALGLGERLVWDLADRGDIPTVKIGRARLFPVSALENWLKVRLDESAPCKGTVGDER